jgi:hypothetical protein
MKEADETQTTTAEAVSGNEERLNAHSGFRLSRRVFLGSGAAATLLATPESKASAAGKEDAPKRQEIVLRIRQEAAQSHYRSKPDPASTNGDEARYTDRRATFTKTLPHNDRGEVEPKAYAAFVAALTSGDSAQFEQIPRDAQTASRLNNPQATFAFDLVADDSHVTYLAPPPAFASAAMAAEVAEVYWQTLTLDVPLREYRSHPLIAAAVADMNAFSAIKGKGSSGNITADTIFRGETPGDVVGPYISQFLWRDIPYGIKTIDQRYTLPTRGQMFLTGYQEWLACQRGIAPTAKLAFDSAPRYICCGRDLAEYVHQDFSFQPYLNAALIMTRFGAEVWSPTNPYRNSRNQFGDVTFGPKNVMSLLAQASLLGIRATWYHKWLVHRRLRPECFAGRMETQRLGRAAYDIHADILRCDAVARVLSGCGSHLIPAPYPEGCPTHPSYPAAHAASAGACAVVLKAFFNEEFVCPNPVQANADGSALEEWREGNLTLGGEINKLAANISLGRDGGGVHYRSDGIGGLLLGEAQGISLLSDYSRAYRERFDGFVLTKFDGKKVRILNGKVTPA